MFPAFLLQLSEGNDHVNGRSVCAEATLGFWVESLRKNLEPLQCYSRKQLPDGDEERDTGCCNQTNLVPRFFSWLRGAIGRVTLVLVKDDDVCIPHMHVVWYYPSFQKRQRILCSSWMAVSVQHLRTSAGMPSLPGALPEARDLRVLLSSFMVGSRSSSSRKGRHSMAFRVFSAMLFSLVCSSEKCSTQRSICCALSWMTSPVAALSGAECLFDALIHAPDVTTVSCWILQRSWSQ